VAEMSKADYQKMDALPAFQEFNVMDCTSQFQMETRILQIVIFPATAYLNGWYPKLFH